MGFVDWVNNGNLGNPGNIHIRDLLGSGKPVTIDTQGTHRLPFILKDFEQYNNTNFPKHAYAINALGRSVCSQLSLLLTIVHRAHTILMDVRDYAAAEQPAATETLSLTLPQDMWENTDILDMLRSRIFFQHWPHRDSARRQTFVVKAMRFEDCLTTFRAQLPDAELACSFYDRGLAL